MSDEIKLSNFGSIKAYGQDGKISTEELEVLKKKGVNQEILDALSGAKSQEEINDIAHKYFNGEQIPEDKSKFKAWLEKSPHHGLLALGAGGLLAATLGLKGLVIGGLASLGACTTEMKQEMNLTISADSSDQEIIEQLKLIHGDLQDLKENQKAQQEAITNMAASLVDIGIDVDRIVSILEGLGANIESISEALVANGIKADEIINLIKLNNDKQNEIIVQISNGNEEAANMLNKIIAAIDNLSESNNQLLTQILAEIINIKNSTFESDKEAQDLLNKILAKVTESVEEQKEINKTTRKFYADVIAKMDSMDANMKDGFQNVIDKMDTLDANQQASANLILAKLESMDDAQKAFFGKVLEKIDKLPAYLQDGVDQLLESIDDNTAVDNSILASLTELISNFENLTPGQVTDLSAVISAIEVLGVDTKAILEQIKSGNSQLGTIKDAILENNKIAQGTQDAINNLAAQNNADNETIIALMTKLLENDANDAATLEDIKAILEEIKTNTKGNLDATLSVDDKLNLVAQTINVILETQTTLGEETKALLLQILAKIPDGCTCETVDLTVIVEKLDALIKATEEGRDDPKHEGILDDLEDLLG